MDCWSSNRFSVEAVPFKVHAVRSGTVPVANDETAAIRVEGIRADTVAVPETGGGVGVGAGVDVGLGVGAGVGAGPPEPPPP